MRPPRTTSPLGPLERELRRRRQVFGRLLGAAGALVIGSAAIVAPEVIDHRDAVRTLQSELEVAAEPLQRVTALQEFEGSGIDALRSAEASIARIAPDEPLPSDFRARLRERLLRMGIDPREIEVGALVYLDERQPGAPEPAFIGTPVRLELTATPEQITTLLEAVTSDARPAFVTALDMERPQGELERISASIELTYMHLNPARTFGRMEEE